MEFGEILGCGRGFSFLDLIWSDMNVSFDCQLLM